MKMFQIILIGLCGCVSAGEPVPGDPPAVSTSAPASPGQTAPTPHDLQHEEEVQTLVGMLTGTDRSTETRYEAAQLLLSRPHPAARKAVAAALSPESLPAVRLAAARAVDGADAYDETFVEPLFTMLADPNDSIRAAAATVLGGHAYEGVRPRLGRVAAERQTDGPTRLAAVAALARRFHPPSIKILIELLSDPDPAVRATTAAALQRLTGLQFGDDQARWLAWWRANRGKPAHQWLADQVEELARRTEAQQRRIDHLADRLGTALAKVYAATAPEARAEMLMNLLGDPLPEVRRTGLQLASARLAGGEPLPDPAAGVLRALLDDPDPRIRAKAALLAAQTGDADIAEPIMVRLSAEGVGEVRAALITALGNLGDPRAISAVLAALTTEPDGAAVEAALAIERLIDANTLDDTDGDKAAAILIERYGRTTNAQAPLRRALLSAMRAVNRPQVAPVLRSALTDPVATIRLEAIRGVRTLNVTEAAAEVAALAADADRGVRQAAIATLGSMGEPAHLDAALARTDPATETDPVVRQRAWETTLALAEKVDDERLADIATSLADRPDAVEWRIRVLRMLAGRVAGDKPTQIAVQMQVAEALLEADRPVEAADLLADIYEDARGSDQAGTLWHAWIQAMLAADDTATLAAIADQADGGLFAMAVDLLIRRLTVLANLGQHDKLITLADDAVERLGDRLGDEHTTAIRELRDATATEQRKADKAQTDELIAALIGADQERRTRAEAALLDMKDRAVLPLVKHLRALLTAETTDEASQQHILRLLEQLAPGLNQFDPSTTTAAKVEAVDAWLLQLESQPSR